MLLLASAGALVVLQVRALQVGLGLVAGIGGTLAALWLVAWAITLLTAAARHRRCVPRAAGDRQSASPGNQTRVVVLALGFGVFLIATLYLVQHNLLRPLRVEGRATRANLVFFDVQAAQQARLAALIQQAGFPVLERTPIVPMRVAAINGRSAASMLPTRSSDSQDEPRSEADRDSQPAGWALRREYRSTFRDTLVGSETLVRGAWWNGAAAVPNGPAPVSLEQDIASDLGVGIGDRIIWDVQGVQIPTQVTSLRTVDWARFEPNFFAVFPTQALSGAPHTWVLLARVPGTQQRAEVQRLAVEGFPNVSAVDLTLVQQTLDQVLDRITTVVRFLAGFSIATGFVVLLGAVATSRLQRIRDSVLLRTLGATRRQIGTVLFTEYLLLGVLASLAGIGLAISAGWGLARWLLKVGFAVPVLPLVVLAAGVSTLAVLVGIVASRETFRHTPLEMLREE